MRDNAPNLAEVTMPTVERSREDVTHQPLSAQNISQPHWITHCVHLLWLRRTCDPVVESLRFRHALPVAIRERAALHRLRVRPWVATVVIPLRQTLEEQPRRRVRVHAGGAVRPPPLPVRALADLLLEDADRESVVPDVVVRDRQRLRDFLICVHDDRTRHARVDRPCLDKARREPDHNAARRDTDIATRADHLTGIAIGLGHAASVLRVHYWRRPIRIVRLQRRHERIPEASILAWLKHHFVDRACVCPYFLHEHFPPQAPDSELLDVHHRRG